MVRKLFVKRKTLIVGLLVSFFVLYCMGASCRADCFDGVAITTSDRVGQFSVASVKASDPHANGWRMEFTVDGFVARNVTLLMLTKEAWNLYGEGEISGGPNWTDKAHFDIQAKIDPSEIEQFRRSDLSSRRLLLQSLLRQRFHLQLQEQRKQTAILALTYRGPGSELQEAKGVPFSNGVPGQDSLVTDSRPGLVKGRNFSMQQLSQLLQQYTGHIVVDETQMHSRYDFSLRWSPEESLERRDQAGDDGTVRSGATAPSLFVAVQEQLGLKLVLKKQLTDVWTIASADPPDAD